MRRGAAAEERAVAAGDEHVGAVGDLLEERVQRALRGLAVMDIAQGR